jgi:hypothetical protein
MPVRFLARPCQEDPALTVLPPNESPPRRYWNYTNRPYKGCGCLCPLLVAIILSVVISALLPNTSLVCLPFVF